ncbi:Gfo/Idh/MocA family protein [Treponema socranskii]|uniref:Gfo/Idh/MocA family protein n=1 Tax=Treponema socranskii TaxID=53419 RepID=UPI003D6F2FA1
MKFLFIGLGSISTKHIKDLAAVANERNIDFEIGILRRKTTELSQELIPYNITQITEFDDGIYDVAFITNPTNLHYQVLNQLKGKVKFYFIEKPIFENCDYDWHKLGIDETNAYVACPMRHTMVYKKLKEVVDRNQVFSARFICSSYLPEWRPNIDYRKNYSAIKALGGGVTLDLIHELDYMVGLFGLPEKVLNVRGKYSGLEIDSDDLSVYIAQYKDKICEVHLDYFGRKYRRTAEIFTSHGTYVADFKTEKIEQPDGTVINCCEKGKTGLYNEMEYFIDFISGKTPENINSPEHGFEVLKITLGINK